MAGAVASEQVARIRIGLAVVAVLHPLFWLLRQGIDPTEADVEHLRLAIVVGAVLVIALTHHRAAMRHAQTIFLGAVTLLLVATSWIVVRQGWGTQYVIGPSVVFFAAGAIAGTGLEAAAVVGVAAVAPLALSLLHGWEPGRLPAIPLLLLASAAIGGAVVSVMRGRSQAELRQEIRRRERVEAELRGARAHLESILNATSDGILGTRYAAEGPIISFANRRFGEIFDLAPTAVLGLGDAAVRAQAAPAFRHPEQFERNVAWLYANPEATRVDELELVHPRSSILERWSGPIQGADGEVVGRIWAFRDVSAQRTMTRERDEHALRLEITNAELARASRAKDLFLANLSHELRTPLSVIIGYLNLVIEGGLSATESRDFQERSVASAIHLLQLISDMLDLTRLESGTAVIEVEPLDVAPVIEEVRSLTEVLARTKGLALAVTVEPCLAVMADRQRLKQVLLNLVGNALKFTARGAVTIGAAAEHGTVVFTVHDTGRGIPSDQQELLFGKFMRLDSRATAPEDGVGLGLSICRELVTLMGGEIGLTSPGLELGTLVRFTLPRAAESFRTVANP